LIGWIEVLGADFLLLIRRFAALFDRLRGIVTHGQKNDHSPLILLRFWLVIGYGLGWVSSDVAGYGV
jgi:hypothetical protein